MRQANTLFEFGRTLLVHKSTGTQIVNADFNASYTDIVGLPIEPAIVIDVARIVASVDDALIELSERNK